MGALRQRLNWSEDGSVHDGPRRYLLMRTDVMMGTLRRLPPAAQTALLQAWAASTQEHGAASLQAYLQMNAGNTAAMIDTTVQAAADLGWGRWAVTPGADGLQLQLQLQVQGSPFVHGWRAAAGDQPAPNPVCAPIAGMFSALACLMLHGPVDITESACAATQHQGHSCHFAARRRAQP